MAVWNETNHKTSWRLSWQKHAILPRHANSNQNHESAEGQAVSKVRIASLLKVAVDDRRYSGIVMKKPIRAAAPLFKQKTAYEM